MANDKLTPISHTEAIEWAMRVLEQTEINTTVVAQAIADTVPEEMEALVRLARGSNA